MAYDLVLRKWGSDAENKILGDFDKLSILTYDDSYGDFSCLLPYKDKIKKLSVSNLLPAGHVIQEFDGLEYLDVVEEKPSLDFSKFRLLNGLVVEWNKKYSMASLYDLDLRFLSIKKWNFLDCAEMRGLERLQVLGMEGGGVRSANGLQKLRELKSISFGGCRYLSDIDSFGLCKNLSNIELSSLPLITDVSILFSLNMLTKLEIDNIGKGCVLPDIEWCSGLINIEDINITNLIDHVDWKIFERFKNLKKLGLIFNGRELNPFSIFQKIAADRGRVVFRESGSFKEGKKSRYFLSM